MLTDARHNDAAALGNARREERKRWQGVVAKKDAKLADNAKKLAYNAKELADNAKELADKDKRIAELEAQLKKID